MLSNNEIIVRQDGTDILDGRARGLIVYSREGLQAYDYQIPGAKSFTECVGISVPWGRQQQLKLVLVYRPPAPPGGPKDGDNTARMCQSLSKLEGNVVIVGDFNMKGIDWDLGWSARSGENMLLEVLQNKFWSQLVREPTHTEGNTLDLVIPSSTELVAKVEVLGYIGPGCDHNMILTYIVGPAREQRNKEEVPDWSKADYDALREAFEAVDWEDEFKDKKGEECMDLFYSVIQRVTDECIPKKLRRAGSRPIWMNKNILRLIRKKKRLWKAYSSQDFYQRDYQSFQAYKKVQNDVKKAVKLAKRKFEKSWAKGAKKNPKAFYSYLKKKTANKVSVGPLMDGDSLVTDDSEMAELLNNFFCSVFTRENLQDMPEPKQIFTGDEPLTETRFETDEVKKKLVKLKPSAAPGPDGVWTRILHKMADVLANLCL